MAKRELTSRLIVAGVGLPLAVLIIYLGGWVLGLLMAVAGAVSASEYYAMAGVRGGKPLAGLGMALSAALPLAATLHPSYRAFVPWAFGLVLATALVAMVLVLWLRRPEGSPLTAAA
ncbi:MAG: phosphatidate cytidylyltransferase, partial [Armatimonadetes bacterium]|nr:phosphatidate cytidylyltransferase [Armatimonadota bacterium]